MTKREKQIVRRCLRELLAEDGDYTGAIGELAALCGMHYPAATALQTTNITTVWKLAAKVLEGK